MVSILKRSKANGSAFADAVARAAEIDAELRRLASLGGKLSATAYLDEAFANAKTTVEKLEKLWKLLADTAGEHEGIDKLLAGAYGLITMPVGSCARPPVGNLVSIFHFNQNAFQQALNECLLWATTGLEVVALAAWRAVRERPDCFGGVANWDEHEARVAELRAEWEEAVAAVDSAATRDDMTWQPAGQDAWRHTYKLRGADTGVPFGRVPELVERYRSISK